MKNYDSETVSKHDSENCSNTIGLDIIEMSVSRRKLENGKMMEYRIFI